MQTILMIALAVAALAFLPGALRPRAPQIIYVQALPPEPARSAGCLPWLIGALVVLVVLMASGL